MRWYIPKGFAFFLGYINKFIRDEAIHPVIKSGCLALRSESILVCSERTMLSSVFVLRMISAH